jgi:hypothetical protein
MPRIADGRRSTIHPGGPGAACRPLGLVRGSMGWARVIVREPVRRRRELRGAAQLNVTELIA